MLRKCITIATVLLFVFLFSACKSGTDSAAEQSLKAEQNLRSGNVKKAIEYYKKAIDIAPDGPCVRVPGTDGGSPALS
jgi:outer membrane protein assembly factor BamD (BamD/ComL family)